MTAAPHAPRKTATTIVVCLLAALAGNLLIRFIAPQLDTDPAWLGPAVVIGAITLLVCGMLLLPALTRMIKRTGS